MLSPAGIHFDTTTGRAFHLEIATVRANMPASQKVPICIINLHSARRNQRHDMLAIRRGFDSTYITYRPFKGIRQLQKTNSRQASSKKAACAYEYKNTHQYNKPIAAMAKLKYASDVTEHKVEPDSSKKRKEQTEKPIIHGKLNILLGYAFERTLSGAQRLNSGGRGRVAGAARLGRRALRGF